MCGGSSLVEDNAVEVEERVGSRHTYADEINVGEVVSFYYTSGSEPGTRTVTVAKVDSDGLEGPTKERGGEYRRYLDNHIDGDILILSVPEEDAPAGDTLRVPFSEAGEKLLASLTGEQLAELYSQYVAVEGDGAEFDANSGEVVVLMPPKVNKVLEVNATSNAQFENKRGEHFGLYLHKGGNKLGIIYKDMDDTNVSLETLRDKLTEFLS